LTKLDAIAPAVFGVMLGPLTGDPDSDYHDTSLRIGVGVIDATQRGVGRRWP